VAECLVSKPGEKVRAWSSTSLAKEDCREQRGKVKRSLAQLSELLDGVFCMAMCQQPR